MTFSRRIQVYISAFVFPGGKSEEAYLLAKKNVFKLYTSIPIMNEVSRKLREKFGWHEKAIVKALKDITKTVKVVKVNKSISLLSDEADNRILECASEVKADLILTGDRHLLSLKRFENAHIDKVGYIFHILPQAYLLKSNTYKLLPVSD